jgi:hypothetical protein
MGGRDFVHQWALKRRGRSQRFMRKRKSIRPLPIVASRWLAWAARLTGQHRRWADGPTAPLLFHIALLRDLILLQQRCFSFHTRVQPKLNLSISGNYEWNGGVKNLYAPHAAFLKLFSGNSVYQPFTLNEHRGKEISALLLQYSRMPRVPVTREIVARQPLALVVARTKTEHLSSKFHQQFSSRHELEITKVSERLIRQVQRVNETTAASPTMALRKEIPAAVSLPGMSADARAERGLLESPPKGTAAQATTMPALNVDQIANQVIQQIDRRVIARRERMGRI